MKWEKFPFKIEKSYRLRGRDYSDEGCYFVTICTKDRVNYFGEIVGSEFYASNMGIMVEKYWKEIPQHFDNVELDEFVVMPNHFHGIIFVKNCCHMVGTHHDAFLQQNKPHDACPQNNENKFNQLANKSTQTIPLAIKLFKGTVKRECNKNHVIFAWQSRYHDRIIRNENELWAKRMYIKNNVKNWNKDKNNLLVV